MAKVAIRTKKYESRSQAEWRYFAAAMLEDKYNPQKVLRAMKDIKNIENAKRWLYGPTKAQQEQGDARQEYINTSKEIDKEIKFMTTHPGFAL